MLVALAATESALEYIVHMTRQSHRALLSGDLWACTDARQFRIKRPGGAPAPERNAIFAAWSPPGDPSFHAPAALRDFVFADR
jgi:hypothetical protein